MQTIIDVFSCVFTDEDGRRVPYYKALVGDERGDGYEKLYLDKLTKEAYTKLVNCCPVYADVIYYDRKQRICGIVQHCE